MWTKEPPTEPGWYWTRWDDDEDPEVWEFDGKYWWMEDCNMLPFETDRYRWSEPIEPPA